MTASVVVDVVPADVAVHTVLVAAAAVPRAPAVVVGDAVAVAAGAALAEIAER